MSSISSEAQAFADWLRKKREEERRIADPDYRNALKEIEEMLAGSRTEWEKRIQVSII